MAERGKMWDEIAGILAAEERKSINMGIAEPLDMVQGSGQSQYVIPPGIIHAFMQPEQPHQEDNSFVQRFELAENYFGE